MMKEINEENVKNRLTAFVMWFLLLIVAVPIAAVVLGLSVLIFCKLAGIG